MAKITYSLDAWSTREDSKLLEWENLEILPRFEAGDYFSAGPFPETEAELRHVVTDAVYRFSGEGDAPAIRLSLHVRPETPFEKSTREDKYRAGFRPSAVG